MRLENPTRDALQTLKTDDPASGLRLDCYSWPRQIRAADCLQPVASNEAPCAEKSEGVKPKDKLDTVESKLEPFEPNREKRYLKSLEHALAIMVAKEIVSSKSLSSLTASLKHMDYDELVDKVNQELKRQDSAMSVSVKSEAKNFIENPQGKSAIKKVELVTTQLRLQDGDGKELDSAKLKRYRLLGE